MACSAVDRIRGGDTISCKRVGSGSVQACGSPSYDSNERWSYVVAQEL
jgi:hypothetical protein